VDSSVSRLLWRASLRHLMGHPWQLGLSLLGIALGVSVVVSVDLAIESARRGFALSTDMVTGKATHQITGGPRGVPEEIYVALRLDLGIRRMAPVISGYAALQQRSGRILQVLGVDPFAEAPFRNHVGTDVGSRDIDLTAFLAEPDTLVISRSLARDLDLVLGDLLPVRVGGQSREGRIVGFLDARRESLPLDSLLIVDIATAQEWFGMRGYLTRIDLALDPAEPDALRRIHEALPAGLRLEPAELRSAALAHMSDAFQLNLSAMSLLALLVGLFLIYNTMSFSVVHRRRLLGTLRALGVTPGEVFRLVLIEAFVLGLLGAALGILLGVWLGHWLIEMVTRTINDLYYVLTVRDLTLSAVSLTKGACLGVGAAVLAAWLPALEAAHVTPSAALRNIELETRIARTLPRLNALALTLLAGGLALLVAYPRSLSAGFGGVFAVLLASALLCPQLLLWLTSLSLPLIAWRTGPVERIAMREIPRTLSRTGPAVAALMVAVATATAVGIMVDSFRETFVVWLEQRLNADLYAAPVDRASGLSAGTLSSAVLAALRDHPQVAEMSAYRSVQVREDGASLQILAVDLTPRMRQSLRFRSGRPGEIWPGFERGDQVLVSEPLAYRRGLGAGDRLNLSTARGRQAFTVGGVFYDYGNEHGRVLIERSAYAALWDDPAIGSVALYLAPGADLQAVKAELEETAGPLQKILIRPNREIRELSMAIFERTFTITEVLRLLALCVAFTGIFSALMAIATEKARQIAVLRAIGVTPQQIAKLVALQTGFLGFAAGLLSTPVGIVLAALLIFAINRRSFGWTFQFQVDPWLLTQGLALAMIAALCAAVYPAWRMARQTPALALCTE
jgi:putative ABC transport system permease protein